MKEKYSHYAADGDIVKISCSLINGNIQIYGAADGKVCVEKTKRTHVKVYIKDNVIKIRQLRRPLFRKTAVKIFIPPHCVPDLDINFRQGALSIENGIYKDLRVKAENARTSFRSACFTNAEIMCGTLALDCGDISIKQLFTVAAEQGSAIIEQSLCTKLDFRFEDGDTGVTELKCRDSSFTTQNGSISVNLKGRKSDYALNLLSKNGTCNCENTDDGEYICKAYTENGKIVVDFTDAPSAAEAETESV